MTPRATRILVLSWGLVAVATAWTLLLHASPLWGWLLAVQAVPFALPLANTLLKPWEGLNQRRYWQQAHTRLLTINPTVIGVTGSFGKTSVKNLLGHVLQTHARTYFTKGSINTPMGVSRAIREEMPDDCRYYVRRNGRILDWLHFQYVPFNTTPARYHHSCG